MYAVKDPSLGAVVVALDGQNADGAAVDWAVDEAVRPGRPLHLVATGEQISPESPLAPMTPFDAVGPTEALEQAAVRVSRLVPDLDVHTTGIEGRLVPLLLRASETADTVVVTGRGTGRVHSVLLGSTAIQVASHASCPVVVVPPDASPRRRGHVVVGVDGSPLSAEAVERRRQGHRAGDLRAGRVARRDDPPAVSLAGRPEAAVSLDRAGFGHGTEVRRQRRHEAGDGVPRRRFEHRGHLTSTFERARQVTTVLGSSHTA
jgi:nucleotide-binding universal stress UspA family protein